MTTSVCPYLDAKCSRVRTIQSLGSLSSNKGSKCLVIMLKEFHVWQHSTKEWFQFHLLDFLPSENGAKYLKSQFLPDYLRVYQFSIYSCVLQLVSRVPFRRNTHQVYFFKTVDYFDDLGP